MKDSILDVSIDNLSMAQVEDRVVDIITRGERGYIVTPNASHVVLFQKDQEFKEAYEKASLILPDGMSIMLCSKIIGKPLHEKITGVDLVFRLSSLAVKARYSVYLLGAEDWVIAETSRVLKERFPGLEIAGYHHGYSENDQEVIDEINKAAPDILFIGLGFPNQEKWISKHLEDLDINVAVCIGGVFDVISGKIKRAPRWMQGACMEWLWRLMQEPRRLWRRYLFGNSEFIFLVIKEYIKGNPGH